MNINSFEFKAKVNDIIVYEEILKEHNPIFKGLDHQIDTYFNVPKGRLKLREGTIEQSLINYNRENVADSKLSQVILYKHKADKALKEILTYQFGVKTIVDKKRKIYFIDNVKFHFDEVKHLGTFIEVEALDSDGSLSIEQLKEQCEFYKNLLGINPSQLIDKSYSDLILDSII